MIIEHNIAKYIVFHEDTILHALGKISENESRIIFSVRENGILEGVLSDGDFRRWLVEQKEINLNQPVSVVSNKTFKSGLINESPESLGRYFSHTVDCLPLLDSQGRLVAIGKRGNGKIQIENREIDVNAPSFIIAEIGNNHNGSLIEAKKLIDEAVRAGADCAKFQMRDLDTLYQNKGKPDDPSADLGQQYTMDLLNKFQLKNDELFSAFDYCHEKGIIPLCTPFDKASLNNLENYGLQGYKVASADFTNHDLLQAMGRIGKPMICSTGMSTEQEVRQSIEFLKKNSNMYILLHCNSTYPTPLKDINLEYMDHLRELGNCMVGYSGHERGINVVLAAIARGAKVIEKHFTLDRTLEGNDHRVSLLPDEFSNMVRGIREIEESLGGNASRKLSQGELMNREVLGKSLYINRTIKKGEIISHDDLAVKSPGQGISPNQIDKLVGSTAVRDMEKGEIFFESDLKNKTIVPRKYSFNRPVGIPVRYHDWDKLSSPADLDFIEFHLSYKDLEENLENFFKGPLELEFTVHCPELFSGDHVLDLCSQDSKYRERSIREVQKVIDVTRDLKKYFPKSKKPVIVLNAGGHTQDAPLKVSERKKYYDLILDSLSKLDHKGIELIPQTMPPFPWHFGGQRFQNLFMDPQETAEFCQQNNYRVCLDISHSKLACNHHKWSFKKFVEVVAPFSALFHIVDGNGVDGEGLQIGEGDVDFVLLGEQLDELAPNIGFIPEIWQGHKNNGEGFWIALDKLEQWF
ncbi:MAG: N-acetylneuraminate synthase family protein [Nitrospinota bacterium]